MTSNRCPDESALFALLDEPDESTAVGAHVSTCAECTAKKNELALLLSDLREPVRVHSSEAFVRRLAEELAKETPVQRELPRRSRRRAFVIAGGVFAAAAMAVVVPRSRLLGDSDAERFTARGVLGDAGAKRDVAIELDVVVRSPRGTAVKPVTEGARVDSNAHLLVSCGTQGAATAFHLLSFAVDAKNEVHWLYPAFEDASSDPASVVLSPGQPMTPMRTEVLLDDVPPGRLRVFALLSTRPMRVSDVERLPTGELTTAGLASRFAGIDVRAWDLAVEAEAEGGGP